MCACSRCIIYPTISYTSLFFFFFFFFFLFFIVLLISSFSIFSFSLYRVADTVARSLSGRGDTFGKVKGRWRVACSMSRKLSYWVGCRSNRDLKRRILLTWRENFSGQNVRSLTSSECLIFLFLFFFSPCARWSCFDINRIKVKRCLFWRKNSVKDPCDFTWDCSSLDQKDFVIGLWFLKHWMLD